MPRGDKPSPTTSRPLLTRNLRPDPYGDGLAILVGSTGGVLPPTKIKHMYYPAKDRRTYQQWNKILGKFGLSDEQLAGQTEKQVVVIPAGNESPMKNCDVDMQLQARHGITWNSCSALPIQISERICPPWVNNDEACRQYLMHLFPIAFRPDGGPVGVKRKERARIRVAKMAYVLYRFFRECATTEVIAEDSGIPVGHVLQVAGGIRNHGWLKGSTKACCRRWHKAHQIAAVKTAHKSSLALPKSPLNDPKPPLQQ